jgi:hypothetical protein
VYAPMPWKFCSPIFMFVPLDIFLSVEDRDVLLAPKKL